MFNVIANRLVRTLYPFGSFRTVRRGPVSGLRYRVSPGMGFSYAWGREAMNWVWFQQRTRPGMCVFDVGANRGQMALFFAKAVGPTGLVVSFEPVPEVYADLVANIEINRLVHVRTHNAAAAGEDGELTFEFDPKYCTQGKLGECEPSYHLDGAKTIKVKAMRLDTLVESGVRPPDFIKIDVEGGARHVLAGAPQILRDHRPELYVELHGPDERTAVKELVQSSGYRIQTLSGEEISDPSSMTENVLWCVPPR